MQKYSKLKSVRLAKLASISLFLFVLACNPQKRLNRLIRKHPELVQKDTIRISDTVIVPAITTDTIWHSKPNDTLYLYKDKLQVQVIRHYDTIRVQANVKPETIVIKHNVPVEKVVVKNEPKKLNKYLIFALVLLFIILFLKK